MIFIFKVKATKEQIEYVKKLLNSVNFGRRGDGTKEYNNGNKEEQFVGILGQVIVLDLFNINKLKINNNKGDHGIDFILGKQRIDIKTMGRHCNIKDYFIHNLHGDQVGSYYKNNIYLLTSLNKKNMELTICGWITKIQFLKKAKFYPKGTIRKNPRKNFKVRSNKGLYEIENYKLNDIKNKDDFIEQMLNFDKNKEVHS